MKETAADDDRFQMHGRWLLWRDHLTALEFAEMRYMVHHRRQVVKPVKVDGVTWWHVTSKGNGER